MIGQLDLAESGTGRDGRSILSNSIRTPPELIRGINYSPKRAMRYLISLGHASLSLAGTGVTVSTEFANLPHTLPLSRHMFLKKRTDVAVLFIGFRQVQTFVSFTK
jgi:hypothetical protein